MKMTHIIAVVSLASTIIISGCAVGEDDHDEGERYNGSSLDVAPVTNPRYRDECGDCHMAYQPGFLPARSWQQIMANLDDHFGENAEVELPLQQQLVDYLMSNAADHSDYKRSRAMMRSLSYDDIPLRISETRYFLRKHDELPARVVQQNPEVKSYSRCEVCHTQADTGSYNEHQVRIPGFGKWED